MSAGSSPRQERAPWRRASAQRPHVPRAYLLRRPRKFMFDVRVVSARACRENSFTI